MPQGRPVRGRRLTRRPRPDPDTPISEIGEFALIDYLVRRLGPAAPKPPAGPGDDAAVVPTGRTTLVTTDTLEEGIHFRRDWSLPEEVGGKALEINLSDIAAMGGEATAAVVSLALPKDLPFGAVDDLYKGLARSARRARVSIAGGNVARAGGDRVAAHVSVLGRPTGRKPILRSGGAPGDVLVVSGTPGLSALGRLLVERATDGKSLWSGSSAAPEWRDNLAGGVNDTATVRLAGLAAGRFLWPTARLEIGIWAAEHGASAMIDLSDGLSGDVRHLAEASGTGVRLDARAFPKPTGVEPLLEQFKISWTDLVLSGGEDYELLIAIPPSKWRGGTPRLRPGLRVIGELTPPREGLRIDDGVSRRSLPDISFRHF